MKDIKELKIGDSVIVYVNGTQCVGKVATLNKSTNKVGVNIGFHTLTHYFDVNFVHLC